MKMRMWPGTSLAEYSMLPPIQQPENSERMYINLLDSMFIAWDMLTFQHLLSKGEEEWFTAYKKDFKKILIDYILAACLGELRHAINKSTLYRDPLHASKRVFGDVPILDLLWIVRHDERLLNKRVPSAEVLWKVLFHNGVPIEGILAMCEYIFSRYSWEHGYGGTNWGYLAKTGIELINSGSDLEDILIFDKIVHLCHAGAQFIGESKYSWLFVSPEFNRFIQWKRRAEYCCWNKSEYPIRGYLDS